MTKHINITMLFTLIGIFGTYDAGKINFFVMLLQSSIVFIIMFLANIITKEDRKGK